MEFSTKPDWERARERIEAWWAGELLDRAVIAVTAPNGRNVEPPPKPPTIEARWTDIEYRIAAHRAGVERTFYGGEAFPLFFVNLGPSVASAYLGCEITFAETTAWQETPVLDAYEEALPFRFDPSNHWWQLTLALTRRAVEELPGISFVSLTDLGLPTDILAHLRGPQRLLVDTIDRPEAVRTALDQLTELWFQWYDELLAIIRERYEGSCGWLAAWSPGRTYPLQCDFSCMISPETYRWMVAPEMVRTIARLDHAIYHLDGPGAIRHLDTLLEMERLHAIQWVPGDGQPSPRWWPELLRRILATGRGVHVGLPPEDVEPLIEEVGPRGLFISTSCRSVEEAEALIRRVERATARAVIRGMA